ncbi:hypothetical protein BgiBS90_013179 [Biomphalaria glabrata]|nr:hypothetical protein BgiBS90_013179 [Biomphalaria glabrata]
MYELFVMRDFTKNEPSLKPTNKKFKLNCADKLLFHDIEICPQNNSPTVWTVATLDITLKHKKNTENKKFESRHQLLKMNRLILVTFTLLFSLYAFDTVFSQLLPPPVGFPPTLAFGGSDSDSVRRLACLQCITTSNPNACVLCAASYFIED